MIGGFKIGNIVKVFISPDVTLKIKNERLGNERHGSEFRFDIFYHNLAPHYTPMNLGQANMNSFSNNGEPSFFDVVVSPHVQNVGDGMDRVFRMSKTVAINSQKLKGRLTFI
jgi:hypothetical protein